MPESSTSIPTASLAVPGSVVGFATSPQSHKPHALTPEPLDHLVRRSALEVEPYDVAMLTDTWQA